MVVEAPLRRQARGQKRRARRSRTAPSGESRRAPPGDERDRREIDDEREHAHRPAGGEAQVGRLSRLSSQASQRAHPGDGMPDCAIESRRIADHRLDRRARRAPEAAIAKADMMAEWTRDRGSPPPSPIMAASSTSPARWSPTRPSPGSTFPPAINPHPYPCRDLRAERWTRLPDTRRARAARSRRRTPLRRPPARPVVVAGPGSQTLIQRSLRFLRREPRRRARRRPTAASRRPCRAGAAVRSDAGSRGSAPRRRGRGQSQQPGRADHSATSSPRLARAPRARATAC